MKVTEYLKEIATKDIKQLSQELQKEQSKLQELRTNIALGKLKNYREIREVRRRIARLQTVISNKAFDLMKDEAVKSEEAPNA